MTNRVTINNVDHAGLRVATRHGADFGDGVNQVAIFPTEFEAVQREYPILFDRDAEGGFQAVALLGLDRDENLFLDGDRWRTHYIPALQRRGPFSIGLQSRGDGGEPEPMIQIDLDDPRVGGEGEPLFLEHGGNAPYLEHVADVLRTIYAGVDMARPMFAALDALGLIQPVALEIMLSDVERYNIGDYWTVDRERLARLDAPALQEMNRAGFLYPAFLAIASLGNVGRLIELKNAKRAAA